MQLYIPQLDELGFRQALLADPATMSYNKGCGLGFAGYHEDTGCIDFPREAWAAWYARWVEDPGRVYAYLEEAGAFLGEVSLYPTAPGVYEIGIVLHSAHRGRGRAQAGLALLLDQAFAKMGAQEATNCFQPERKAALRIHRAAGFQVEREEEGLLHLSLKRENWRQKG